MISSPGFTVDVRPASPGWVEVAVPPGVEAPLPSGGTSVEVEERAVLSSEFWVIVEVEAEEERPDDDVVPRWLSLSSAHERKWGKPVNARKQKNEDSAS